MRVGAVVALAASLLLVGLPLTMHLHRGDYVIAHDANVPATAEKAVEQLELLKRQNGGLVQGIVPPISFMTALLYGLPLAVGVPPTIVQTIVMTVTFAATLLLAVSGFGALLAGGGTPPRTRREVDAWLVGSLYVVAPFTLVYVSYGVFWSVNVALAIGTLPFMVHFFIRCFVDERDGLDIQSVAALALCLIVVAWSILFVFPALLIGLALLAVRGGLGRLDLLKLSVVGLLTGLGSLFSLYGMYISVIDAGWQTPFDPITKNAAWGNIQGGILTGFLQYTAWTIYTSWVPRLLLGFPSHFFSSFYIFLTLMVLALVIAFPILSMEVRARARYLYAATIFLVAVFFVKGAGEPLGTIYLGLLSTVPGAGLIRTPDTKFGVFVILGLACALAFGLASRDVALARYRAACRFLIVLVVAYHAVPFINGQAILGRHSEYAVGESDRGYAVHPSETEHRIIDVLRSAPSEGVVILPSNFGNTHRDGGVFSYRSVVGEFVPNGLYYAAWDEMPNQGVKQQLRRAVNEGAWWLLPNLGVGFLLVNRNSLDTRVAGYQILQAVKNAPQAWEKVLDADGYELYRLRNEFRKPNVAVITEHGKAPLKIARMRGWLAVTRPENISGRFTVQFRVTENRHWRLLVMPPDCEPTSYACLLRALLSPSPSWQVARLPSPDYLDNRWSIYTGSSPRAAAIAIVFMPQLVMYALLAVSIAAAMVCLCLLRRRTPCHKSQE